MEIIIGIVAGAILLFGLYTVVPNYFARQLSKQVVRRLSFDATEKKIALTFDDGPHPEYTPLVLDVLKTHGVKATFFVVAKNAIKNPEILERMVNEGHHIAMHSLKHKSAWETPPHGTLREFRDFTAQIKNIGLKVDSFRPPWGTFNLLTLRGARKQGMKVILWSVEAHDWRKNNSPEKIAQVIEDRVKSNDIIVLHDSGGAEGAPNNTIGSLKLWIPKLREKGYQFVTIEEEIMHVSN